MKAKNEGGISNGMQRMGRFYVFPMAYAETAGLLAMVVAARK